MSKEDNFKNFIDNSDKIIDEVNDEKAESERPHIKKEKETFLNFKHKKIETVIGISVIIIALLIFSVSVYIFFVSDDKPNYGYFLNNLMEKYQPSEEIMPPEKSTQNYFEIFTEGKFKIEYYDGSNIPKELFGQGYTKIEFDCWYDDSNVPHFLGIIQIIEGDLLYSDLHIIGYYPSKSEPIGEGQSLTWEGLCEI